MAPSHRRSPCRQVMEVFEVVDPVSAVKETGGSVDDEYLVNSLDAAAPVSL